MKNIQRFLWCALVALTYLSPIAAQKKRPNILFILTDDQRADAIHANGNKDIITPNLDQLVAQGFSFKENYCMGASQGAVCSASRAMILTGKSMFNIPKSYSVPWQVPKEEQGLVDCIIMPEVFRQHGYSTFITGKWHQEGPTLTTGFSQGKNIFVGGMGSHTDVKIWDFDPTGKHYGKDDYHLVKGFSSTLFANAAVDFIAHERPQDKPFFMYVAFTAPHDPRTPPEEYRKMYHDKDLSVPKNWLPYHPFNNDDINGRDEHTAAFPRTKAVVQNALGDYYGMITHMDAQIGRIIKALKVSGEYDNTYIVFTSDHGLAIGSHGLMGKQSVYADSMRAPLVICGPGIKGNMESDAFTYLFDLFPTMLNFANIDIPNSVEGENLASLVKGGKIKKRKYIFNAFRDTQRAVTTDDWKYIRYPELDKDQLFHIKKDPQEVNDLAQLPKYFNELNRLKTILLEEQKKYNDTLPLTAKRIVSSKYDPETFFSKKKKK